MLLSEMERASEEGICGCWREEGDVEGNLGERVGSLELLRKCSRKKGVISGDKLLRGQVR